jgi:hypothetical protein
LRKHLFLAVGTAALLASGAASAQGLPFASTNNTSVPWNVNRAEPRDMNAYHASADQQQPGGSVISPNRITTKN